MDKGAVYILRCKNGRYYIGSTNNLRRRLNEHEQGIVSATKHVRPIVLVFSHEFATLVKARQVKYRLKKQKSRVLIEHIISDKHIQFAE